MKRRIMLLAGILAISLLSFSQSIQRLAVLPASMNLAKGGLGSASSLCIDWFRPGPSGQQYGEINPGSEFKLNSTAPDHTRVRFHGGVPPANTTFRGATNEAVPNYYQEFIAAKIDKYKSGFNKERLSELQNEIWAYDGMNQLGWIDRTATDQVAEFEAKQKEFLSKYDLGHEAGADINMQIADKTKQLHYISMDPVPANPPTDAKLAQDGISFLQQGQTRRINVNYEQAEFKNILYPENIGASIDDFWSAYHTAPEEAKIAYANDPNNYVLTLKSHYGLYRMNSLVPMHRIVFRNKLLPGTSTNEVCLRSK